MVNGGDNGVGVLASTELACADYSGAVVDGVLLGQQS